MKNIIAIDVGNGFCKAAILLDAAQDPIPLIPATMPMGMRSVAYVEPGGKISVNPKKMPAKYDTVRDVKIHLGKAELQLSAGGTDFTVDPGKVYGAVAREVIRLANETLKQMGKEPAYQVVVTYPSDFIDTPKPGIMKRSIERLTLDGNKLKVIAMLPEPVAAAVDTLYYEHNIKADSAPKNSYNIAVYDLGHGTLDVAVVTSTGDKSNPFDVICQRGDSDVCGRIFDEKIYERLCRQLGGAEPFKPSARDYQELRFKHAVDIKHELSNTDVVYKSFIREGDEDFTELSLTKQDFESMIGTDIRSTLTCVAQMLETAGQKGTTIREIVLTGGSSRIPMIERVLNETFGSAGITVRSFRPTHAVVNGAARYAQQVVVRQHAEHAYGLYVGAEDQVYMMIGPDEVLTANAQPQSFTASSCDMQLRVCRSKNRLSNAQKLPYRECDEVRRFRFESRADQNYQITISIDEDRRLTVACTDPDGKTVKQSTFDQQ